MCVTSSGLTRNEQILAALPVTQVSVKWLFSAIKLLMTDLRFRFKPDVIEAMMCSGPIWNWNKDRKGYIWIFLLCTYMQSMDEAEYPNWRVSSYGKLFIAGKAQKIEFSQIKHVSKLIV